jgi:hypothetical protein
MHGCGQQAGDDTHLQHLLSRYPDPPCNITTPPSYTSTAGVSTSQPLPCAFLADTQPGGQQQCPVSGEAAAQAAEAAAQPARITAGLETASLHAEAPPQHPLLTCPNQEQGLSAVLAQAQVQVPQEQPEQPEQLQQGQIQGPEQLAAGGGAAPLQQVDGVDAAGGNAFGSALAESARILALPPAVATSPPALPASAAVPPPVVPPADGVLLPPPGDECQLPGDLVEGYGIKATRVLTSSERPAT